MAQGHATATSRVERSTAASLSDRTLVIAVLVGLAWLAMYAGLTFASRHSNAVSTFVANVVYLLPIAAAVCLAAFAALRTAGRWRLVWWLLTGSTLSWLAGEIAWAVESYQSAGIPPIPSAADIGFLLQYVIGLPAVLIGMRVGALAQTRGLLDALLVGGAVAAIGWRSSTAG